MRSTFTPLVRLLVLAAGAAVTGLVAFAPAAAADVTITPAEAVQGSATSVTFLVENQRPRAHTVKVEVDLPSQTPIAEVYPMTVPDWAPKIVYREVATKLAGIHGSGLTTATSAIIWTRSDDAPAPPPVERLRLEMGPLPMTDRFAFTVVQTYSDGTVQRWGGTSSASADTGTVLALKPGGSVSGSAGHGHVQDQAGTSPATSGVAPAPAAAASTAAPQDDASALNPLTAGTVGAVSAGLVVLLVVTARGSRRPTVVRAPSARDEATTSEAENAEVN